MCQHINETRFYSHAYVLYRLQPTHEATFVKAPVQVDCKSIFSSGYPFCLQNSRAKGKGISSPPSSTGAVDFKRQPITILASLAPVHKSKAILDVIKKYIENQQEPPSERAIKTSKALKKV
jgi:putative transposase